MDAKLAMKLVTAEELLAMADDERQLELVAGEVVESPLSGQRHSELGALLVSRLTEYVYRSGLGICTQANGGYVLSRDPDTVRIPDAAFVSKSRLPEGRAAEGFFEGPPDLAVEIVSPSQTPSDIEPKIDDYLRAGTRLVWVVYPQLSAVRVCRSNGTTELVREGLLSGEDVIPGLKLPLSDIFR